MVKFISSLILLSMLSCINYNRSVNHSSGRTGYLLKGKIGHQVPQELDTLNLYKYYGYYNKNNYLIKDNSLNDWHIYNKYYKNGKFFSFGTNKLTQKNLNPDFGTKGYYTYNSKENVIKCEVYTNGNGGQYVILNYKISKFGDTLTCYDKNKKQNVYIKTEIPKDWERFKANW